MRIMGLDYGSKTVGVALSDALLLTAQPFETIERTEENKLRRTCARIEEIIREYEVQEIILGLPLHMDDTASPVSEKVCAFQEMLVRRTGLPVILSDERLTTVEADEILAESGVKKSERKKYIDKIAASFILQEYLDNRKGGILNDGTNHISDR